MSDTGHNVAYPQQSLVNVCRVLRDKGPASGAFLDGGPIAKELADTNRAESMLFRTYNHGYVLQRIIRTSTDMASQLQKIVKLLVDL